jgi:hypothetical protein
MEIYRTKTRPLAGTNYSEIVPKARKLYKQISSRTKRRPYLRSKYFEGQKIFLDYFWSHIMSKNPADRTRRLRQYPCALDIIMNTRIEPVSKENPSKSSEILHRFSGENSNGEIFFVQIKEEKKSGEKCLMSIFPEK